MKLSFKIKNNKDHCHCVYLWFSERTVLGMWYGYHKNHDAIIIHFCEKCSRMKIGITFVHAFVYPKILMNKESNSTANESKWQFNRSIIYYLNIVPIVNDSFWNSFWKKKEKWSCRDSNSRQGKCSALVTVGRYTIAPQSWDIYFGSNFSLRM